MASSGMDLNSMEQDSLNLMFHEGAMLVFADVPVGFLFGVDYNSWHVGEKFRGIKMIPPGLHYIYYSACNSEGQAAPRTGFFHFFKKKEVLVKKWSNITEDIQLEPVSEDEVERYKSNKEQLDKYTAPYPFENFKKWLSLTNHITEDFLLQIQPLSGRISAVTQFISESSTTESRKAAQPTQDSEPTDKVPNLPHMKVVTGSEIRFTKIPTKLHYPKGLNPSEITKYSMDSSYKLTVLLDSVYSENPLNILGELQFAFVCFLIGQVFDAFEQWKTLVHLLCSCEDALKSQPDLFLKFISVLHFQIREIPEDFFVDIVSSNNFLTTTLQEFFSNLENCDDECVAMLRKRGLSFRDHLQKKFNWDFTSDPDDFSPVVVQVDA